MILPALAAAIACLIPASIACAEDAAVPMTLGVMAPPILLESVPRFTPPPAQGIRGNLWLPPKHTDEIVPLGLFWSLPPLTPTKATPYSASPETFTTRVVGQILYVKPESIATPIKPAASP